MSRNSIFYDGTNAIKRRLLIARRYIYRISHRLSEAARGIRRYLKAMAKHLIPLLLILYTILIAPLAYELYIYAISVAGRAPVDLRDSLLGLGAVVGAPFIVWRTWIAWLQADVAQQTHITELFTKAVEQLGAEKETPHSDGRAKIPNIELRIGAILALDRIANDSPKDYWRVMEVLSSYVRNNSPVVDQDFDAENDVIEAIRANAEELREWLKDIKKPRADIQFAIDILGRRNKAGIKFEKHNKLRLDLSKANLRNIRFSRWYDDVHGANAGCLANADFTESKLDGSDLTSVDLSGCVFNRASLIGAIFLGSMLDDAEFHNCEMDLACVAGARMRRVDIQRSRGVHIDLSEADLRDGGVIGNSFSCAELRSADCKRAGILNNNFAFADLTRIKLEKAIFSNNDLTKAKVYDADFSKLDYRYSSNTMRFENAFGDSTTKVPEGARPGAWPTRELSYDERRDEA